MRLARFITENLEDILAEWEAFASSLVAPGQVMTSLALRDHASQILLAIVEDIESSQTDLEQAYKSKGFAPDRRGDEDRRHDARRAAPSRRIRPAPARG